MRERRKEPREGSEIDPETACIQKVGAQLQTSSSLEGLVALLDGVMPSRDELASEIDPRRQRRGMKVRVFEAG